MHTNKKETLEKIFALARMKGLCKTQKEFAELVSVHPSTISLAMKGDPKYLTDKLVLAVERWAKIEGLEDPQPEQPAQPDILIPAATAALYNNMSETIRIQAEIIARLQGGATRFPVDGYAPKNTRTDLTER